MNNRKMRKAMKAVAKANGITEAQAVTEIENMIFAVIQKAKLENDQQTLEKWEEIPCERDVPTAYELIDYLSRKLTERLPDYERCE